MDKLLTAVLDAHGGLQNWAKATKITARMSLGGPFWAARGWPDVYSKQTVTIDPHREHIASGSTDGAGRSRWRAMRSARSLARDPLRELVAIIATDLVIVGAIVAVAVL